MPGDVSTQPLFSAVFRGHADAVQSYVGGAADAALRDAHGREPLHVAALAGNDAVVQVLLRRGARVDAADRDGRTAAHCAAHEGCFAVLRLLVAALPASGTLPDANGDTPLHLAAQFGHSACVQILVHEAGASINHRNHDGLTALHMAAREGHLGICMYLLDGDTKLLDGDELRELFATEPGRPGAASRHGRPAPGGVEPLPGGVTADLSLVDACFNSPLHLAAMFGRVDVVGYLAHRASREQINAANMASNTALHLAAAGGHARAAALLLAAGCEARVFNIGELTPFHVAAMGGYLKCLRCLVIGRDSAKAFAGRDGGPPPGPDPGASARRQAMRDTLGLDSTTASSAALAGTDGAPKAPEQLDDARACDGLGRTVLELASEEGHAATVSYALQTLQLPVTHADELGMTCLHYAARGGFAPVMELLLAQPAIQVDRQDAYGLTPMHWATLRGHPDAIRLLRRTGLADPDVPDVDGNTPLHWAHSGDHAPVIDALLHAGASQMVRNGAGDLPADMRASMAHFKTYQHPALPADVGGVMPDEAQAPAVPEARTSEGMSELDQLLQERAKARSTPRKQSSAKSRSSPAAMLPVVRPTSASRSTRTATRAAPGRHSLVTAVSPVAASSTSPAAAPAPKKPLGFGSSSLRFGKDSPFADVQTRSAGGTGGAPSSVSPRTRSASRRSATATTTAAGKKSASALSSHSHHGHHAHASHATHTDENTRPKLVVPRHKVSLTLPAVREIKPLSFATDRRKSVGPNDLAATAASRRPPPPADVDFREDERVSAVLDYRWARESDVVGPALTERDVHSILKASASGSRVSWA